MVINPWIDKSKTFFFLSLANTSDKLFSCKKKIFEFCKRYLNYSSTFKKKNFVKIWLKINKLTNNFKLNELTTKHNNNDK